MKTRCATVSFKTVGCRLNQAETAVIRAAFEEAGYKTVPFGEQSDICVIHGCVVTARAEEDSVRLARSIKRRYPNAFVVLAGCAAEYLAAPFCHSRARLGEALWRSREGGNPDKDLLDSRLHGNDKSFNTPNKQIKHADIDYLAGQNEKYNLPDILSQGGLSLEKEKRSILPSFNTKRAMVKIQDGCDCRCAYCIVPNVRGASRSRPGNEIIDEITRLTLSGFTEIVLTGANIGCYADGFLRLPQLLEKVEAISSLQRFRISSLEISNVDSSFPIKSSLPAYARLPELSQGIQSTSGGWIPACAGMTDTTREVIDFMAVSKKMCFYLHLPLQSGSNRILKAMGRPYTAEKYCSIIEYAQKKLGTFGLGTDIIVGFPGETDKDFQATEQIVSQLPFSKLHVFSYSPRPGTPAALLSDQVSQKDKETRVKKLIELGCQKRKDFARSFVGKRLSFVVEKVKDGWAEGWTSEYLRARVRAANLQLKQIASFICKRAEDDILIDR